MIKHRYINKWISRLNNNPGNKLLKIKDGLKDKVFIIGKNPNAELVELGERDGGGSFIRVNLIEPGNEDYCKECERLIDINILKRFKIKKLGFFNRLINKLFPDD